MHRRTLFGLLGAGLAAVAGSARGRDARPRMIYLDNAATSFPKPEPVYKALETFARETLANPWNSPYEMAAEANGVMEEVRARLDRLFRGDGPDRWVHTFNGTDGLNMAIKGSLKSGDHVVTTDLEHDSVTRPLNALEHAGIITQTRVASAEGYVDPEAIRRAITAKTRMVAVTHASNLTGTVQPIDAIARVVRDAGALFLVDGAQSAGQTTPPDLQETPIDLLALSCHKLLFGPTGTGALYVGARADVRPWREGDTGGKGSERKELQPEGLPHRLEGGTPNVLGLAGLSAGLGWVAEHDPEAVRRRLVDLLEPVVDWARAHDGWNVVGRWEPATHIGVLSLAAKDRDIKEVATALDRRFGIAVRPGLHDALDANRALGTFPDGTLRISPGPFTTERDIDTLLDALTRIDKGRA